MTLRRPALATAVVLTTVFGGVSFTGAAGARSVFTPKITTSLPVVNTIATCYAGPNCQPKTKNAALPTTTVAKSSSKKATAPASTTAKSKGKTKSGG